MIILEKSKNGTLAGAWLIQARRFASRSSTRQTTHLNSDKKTNSKPSETGRSPLNRLANRPVVLRSSAYFEFHSFYIFRAFFAPFCFGRRFPAPSFFTTAKTIFQSFSSMTLLPENVKNPRKTYFNPFTLFIGVWYNRRRYNGITFWYISVTSMSLCLLNSRGIVVTQSNSQRRIARIASRVF